MNVLRRAAGALLAFGLAIPFAALAVLAIQYESGKLEPTDDGVARHDFGRAVALSDDGHTLAIGDPDADAARGVVYVYSFDVNNGSWDLTQRLASPAPMPTTEFGAAVAFAGDALVVGAPKDGFFAGAVHIYESVAGTWSLVQTVRASNADYSDRFGSDVAGSGDTILAGRTRAGANGSAIVFVRGAEGWVEQQQLGVGAATAVALSGDTALVGSWECECARVYVRSAGAWTLQAQLQPEVEIPGSGFGYSVAIDGDTIIVGAPHPLEPQATGGAYVFSRTAGSWTQVQVLTPFDGVPDMGFGSAVSLDGSAAVIGAPAWTLTESAGSALIYALIDGSWVESRRIDAPAYESREGTGSAVAVRAGFVAVGGPLANPPGSKDGGVVQLRERVDADSWGPLARIWPPDGGTDGDFFGDAIAISGDTAIVGAPHDSTAAGEGLGSASVFVRNGSSWELVQELTGSTPRVGFGYSAAISGNRAMVGSNGVVYAFERTGATWYETQAIDAFPALDFGSALAMSGDLAVISDPFAPDPATGEYGAGVAHVLARDGSGIWVSQQSLTAPDAEAGSGFAVTVAIVGETILVGMPFDDNGVAGIGSVRVFERGAGGWSQTQVLTAPDGDASDGFGGGLAVSGNTVVVGTYVFTLVAGTWTYQQKLRAPDGDPSDGFGASVAISGDRIVVGASSHAGIVYAYERSGGQWFFAGKFGASDSGTDDGLGHAVAITGEYVLTGAPWHDLPGEPDSGAVYAFELPLRAPAPFTFKPRTGLATKTLVVSAAKTMTGYAGVLPVSVSPGGEYSIDGGAWTKVPGEIAAESKLRVRHTTAHSANTEKVTTVTVGPYSTDFKTVTGSVDRTPDAFKFPTRKGVAAGSLVESAPITLTGFNTTVPVTPLAGVEWRSGEGDYSTAAGSLSPGQTLQVRHTASMTSGGSVTSSIRVGGINGTFATKTQ